MLKKIKSYIEKINENDKIIYKNSIVSFFLQMFSIVVGVIVVPAYIDFFCNSTVLGMWYAVLSILNWIIDFDIGIGNGLKNHLTTALSENKKDLVKSYISSAYFCYGAISVIVLAACLFFGNVNFNDVLNLDEAIVPAKELKAVMCVVFVSVVVQFFLKLISSVICALQKNALNLVVNFVTNLIFVIFLLVYPTKSNAENLMAVAVFRAVSVILPLLITSIYIFRKTLSYAVPNIKYVNRDCSKSVVLLGSKFFIIQIFYMLIIGTNEILITRLIGNDYNVEYQIYYKIFYMVVIVFSLVSVPLWSVVTKAKAENNYLWIKTGYKKYMCLGLLFCIGTFLLLFIIKPLIKIWLGADAPVDSNINTTVWFAVYTCLMIVISVFSAFAMGLEKMKTQTICYIIGAIIKIPLSKYLVEVTGSWVGVVIATCICLGMYCVVQFIVFQKYFRGKEFQIHTY